MSRDRLSRRVPFFLGEARKKIVERLRYICAAICNRMAMAEKEVSLSSREKRLLAKQGENSELLNRLETILDLANEDGYSPIRSADEIEFVLIDELRKLGNETLSHWAVNAEQKVANDYQSERTEAATAL